MSIVRHSRNGKHRYPLAKIAFYGPDNQRASKVIASVIPARDQDGTTRRWFSASADARYDEQITNEIVEFLKQHNVVESIFSDQIIGCPHEEGLDYPLGGICPNCSFWWNIDRRTRELSGPVGSSRVGRNEPCDCGSGKKHKKCCGAA
jgi:hypothetical protein